MEQLLQRIFDELAYLRANMATKDDIAAVNKRIDQIEQTMATKDDIISIEQRMATKDDIASIEQRMATKDDIASIEQRMATKDDIAAVNKRIDQIEQTMATKDDVALVPAIREMVGQLMERMTVVELHVQEIPAMKQQIEQLSQQMEEGFEKIAHQETILQALSLRSIQQANDIHRSAISKLHFVRVLGSKNKLATNVCLLTFHVSPFANRSASCKMASTSSTESSANVSKCI